MSTTISASLVKELRDQTGAGMMDCKRALEETGGDLEAAQKLLREKGIADAAKRSGRDTTEGKVGFSITEESVAAMVAIGCETEPVSNNEEFLVYAQRVLSAVLHHGVDAADSLEDERVELVARHAENIAVVGTARYEGAEHEILTAYVHPPANKLGVLLHAKGEPDLAGEDHAVDAVPLRGDRDQHDEGAGGPADLEATAAEQRHDEATDDSGVEPAVRRHARGDCDRHRQRQRDDGNRQAREHIGAEIREAVAFAPDGDELGEIEFGKGRPTQLMQLACVFACDAHFRRVLRCSQCSGASCSARVRRCASSSRARSTRSCSHAARRSRLLQANAPPAAVAAGLLADQLDAGPVERLDHLDQGLDHAAHIAGAGLHPLDGRQRNAGEFGQGFLVNAKQRAGCPHLERRDHRGLTYQSL